MMSPHFPTLPAAHATTLPVQAPSAHHLLRILDAGKAQECFHFGDKAAVAACRAVWACSPRPACEVGEHNGCRWVGGSRRRVRLAWTPQRKQRVQEGKQSTDQNHGQAGLHGCQGRHTSGGHGGACLRVMASGHQPRRGILCPILMYGGLCIQEAMQEDRQNAAA